MFDAIDLSAYADPILDDLASGPIRPVDGSIFLQHIQQAQGPILELGCGTGRYTIPLAERGIDMTGVELSTPSLAYAHEKAGQIPIHWVEADVRDFHLGTRFPLVFARGCVINFLLTRADQEAMLAGVREHLTDDGIFMLDVCYRRPRHMVDLTDEVEWYTLTHPNGREVYVTGTERFDDLRQLWIQTCYERWDKPDGELVRPPWTLTLRIFGPTEMETLLHYNGFTIVERYAKWDDSPDAEDCEFCPILICQKRD